MTQVDFDLYNDGFKKIKVELINFAGNTLAKQVCCFGQGAEFYEGFKPHSKKYK